MFQFNEPFYDIMKKNGKAAHYDRVGKAESDRSTHARTESEHKFRALFNNTYDAIFLMKEDMFIDCNPKTEVMFGCSRDELLSKKPYDFSPVVQPDGKNSREKALEKIHKALRGIPQSFEWTHCRKDGSRFDAEVSLNKIDIDGELLIQAIVRDITARKETEAELRYRVDFEKFIASISTNFITLAPDEIDNGIHNTLEDIGIFAGVDRSFIFLLDEDSGEYRAVYEWCSDGIARLSGYNLSFSEDSFPWLHGKLSRSENIRIADVSILPGSAKSEKQLLQSIGSKSILCVPLRIGKSLIGFFGFDSVTRKKDWPLEALTLLRIVGEIIANSIERKRRDEENTRLYRTVQRQHSITSALLQTALSIVEQKDVRQVLALIAEQAQRITRVNRCAVFLWSDIHDRLDPIVVITPNPERIPPLERLVVKPGDAPILSEIMKRRDPIIVDEGRVAMLLPKKIVETFDIRSMMVIPFFKGGKLLGGMTLDDTHKAHSFTDEDMAAAIGIANQAAVAIENARLFEQIRASEERYRSLFEDSIDGVYTSSEDGRIININPAGIELLGYDSEEEVKNLDVAKDIYLHPHRREEYKRALKQNGFVKDFEAILKRKDGSTIFCLITSTAFTDHTTGKVCYRGFIRDVTDKKLLEDKLRQTQKMESLGQLAGGIAHDFNNVLGIVQASLSALKGKIQNTNNGLHQYVEMGENAVIRGADVARRLLTFSQSNEVQRVPLHIRGVVRDLTDVLRHTIEKSVTIETRIAQGVSPVLGDHGQLYQMLLNLCVNARDALIESSNGGICGTIRIEVDQVGAKYVPGMKKTKKNDQYLRISVSDNGNGMPDHIQNKIFEPFFTTKSNGTGLGLSVVYGIVQAHNGVVDVRSEQGNGTSFNIYIPIVDVELEQVIDDDTEEIGGGNETILVVEDEVVICKLLEEILVARGYSVLTAGDGSEALKLYRKHREGIDVVIMDMGLPKLSGQALFLNIKQINPDATIILASGYVDEDLRRDLFELGAAAFVQKPYRSQEILNSIRTVLKDRQVITN